MKAKEQLDIESQPVSEPVKVSGARQSWGEVVQYLDGWCWGIAPDGKTICLGKEADIKEMLADPTKKSANATINEIIDLERELNKENDNDRTTKIKRPGDFRSRPSRNFEHRETNARRPPAGKRVAVHKA